ncbi:hypothetical protein [Flavobacterium sp.]|uniref:hypothetical protein n=1 Tax=Flavobacterium sp. TaxID=239 RepID=UPI00375115AD
MSYPDVNIQNSCGFTAAGTISYAACSSDNYNLGNGSGQSFSRGVCLVTEITATVSLPTGNVNATPYSSSGTSYSQYAVIQSKPGEYAVTRVVNLVGQNQQIIKSKLEQSSAHYGINPNEDVEITALIIKQQQEQQLLTNWPANIPKPMTVNTGTLLCALRSKEVDSEKKEVSCVHGCLEEINRDSKLGLSSVDINELTTTFLKAMIKNRFKMSYEGDTYKNEKGQTVHWGLSVCAEPLENDKDAVIYTIAITVE